MMEPDIRCEWLSGHGVGSGYRVAKCGKPATMIGFGDIEHPHYSRVFCAAHGKLARETDSWIVRVDPLIRDPRVVSLMLGALAGALDPSIMAILVKGDAASVQVALDLVEERGLHEGGYGPERYEEWAEATRHEHVWLPWETGDEQRATRGPVGSIRLDAWRCPCGVFEHEWIDVEANALRIPPEWDACRACGAPQQPGSQRHCGALACIERVGNDCPDRNCQRERDHDGLHMSRSAIHGYGGIEEQIDEWGDVEPGDVADLLDERAAMDDVARDAAR